MACRLFVCIIFACDPQFSSSQRLLLQLHCSLHPRRRRSNVRSFSLSVVIYGSCEVGRCRFGADSVCSFYCDVFQLASPSDFKSNSPLVCVASPSCSIDIGPVNKVINMLAVWHKGAASSSANFRILSVPEQFLALHFATVALAS